MEIFARGDIVGIKSGPFTNSKGQVEAVHPTHPYLKIVVQIFGRPTPIEWSDSRPCSASQMRRSY
jgi:transcription antitermination factor NusG